MTSDRSMPTPSLTDRPEAASPTYDDMLLPSASTLIYVNPDPVHPRSWLSWLRRRGDVDLDAVAQMNVRYLTDDERRQAG